MLKKIDQDHWYSFFIWNFYRWARHWNVPNTQTGNFLIGRLNYSRFFNTKKKEWQKLYGLLEQNYRICQSMAVKTASWGCLWSRQKPIIKNPIFFISLYHIKEFLSTDVVAGMDAGEKKKIGDGGQHQNSTNLQSYLLKNAGNKLKQTTMREIPKESNFTEHEPSNLQITSEQIQDVSFPLK